MLNLSTTQHSTRQRDTTGHNATQCNSTDTTQQRHNGSQHNATQQNRHNTTDRNATQHNGLQRNATQQISPQHDITGNKNHTNMLNNPVEVTSSSTKNSTEKKTVKKRYILERSVRIKYDHLSEIVVAMRTSPPPSLLSVTLLMMLTDATPTIGSV